MVEGEIMSDGEEKVRSRPGKYFLRKSQDISFLNQNRAPLSQVPFWVSGQSSNINGTRYSAMRLPGLQQSFQ